MEGKASEPIAIVGASCRFPGGANSVDDLWDLLRDGHSAWSEIPTDRMNMNGYYHPDPEHRDSLHIKGAHFLKGDIGAFDAKFFSISSREAKAIDPQQRMLLELTHEALENAGIPKESVAGSKTSVIIGCFVKDYELVSNRDPQVMLPDTAIGNSIAILSNRISYEYDLRGTAQTVDTGCSASSVAMYQAINELRGGRSNMAITGGCGLILTPATMMPMTSLGFLSADGKSYAFDSRGDGYGRGEGVGLVVLKRLSDAVRDNDTIRAVIRGVASNQDGRTNGITVPNPKAQADCIYSAYNDANLDVNQTAYVECHGTGTIAGDPKELEAIGSVFKTHRQPEYPMFLGSIKPNVGHLEGAAGVAGVIRAMLILERGEIPPHINFEKWNPRIDHDWSVDLALSPRPFPQYGPSSVLRRASVNCFGFGGTNVHAVLDDAGSFLDSMKVKGHHRDTRRAIAASPAAETASPNSPYLFVYSAQHKDGLIKTIQMHHDYTSHHAAGDSILRDYSYTLYSRRSQFDYKAAFVASSLSELAGKLKQFKDSQVIYTSQRVKKGLRPGLVFSGQGAAWAKMGVDLMVFEPYKRSMEEADKYMRAISGDLNLLDSIAEAAGQSSINKAEVSQPATTAVQIALVDLLRATGIKPVAVVGHSSGEIAAAYAAGFITREAAWALAFHRGRWSATVNVACKGGMLAVGLSKSDAQSLIDRVAAPGSVCVACVNSPRLVTLSGDHEEIEKVQTELRTLGVFNRRLAVDIAYHSHHMAQHSVATSYLESITSSGDCAIKPTEMLGHDAVVMYSSLLGRAVAREEITAQYWVDNLLNPVEFQDAVTAMMKPGKNGKAAAPNFLIEASPHSTLASSVADILAEIGVNSIPYAPMLLRAENGVAAISGFIGQVWSAGHRVGMDWFWKSQNDDDKPMCLVDLPRYAWDHSKSYWAESDHSKQYRFRQFGSRDLIGAPTPESILPYQPTWRGHLRLSENPWMVDHKVRREILYPAAGMIAMAIEAARQVVHGHVEQPSDIVDYEVSRLAISEPMVIPTNENGLEHTLSAKRIQDTVARKVTSWTYEFAIYSKQEQGIPYTENARGLFTVRFYAHGAQPHKNVSALNGDGQTNGISNHGNEWELPRNRRRDSKFTSSDMQGKDSELSPFEFYEGLDVIGMNYGPLFQNITWIGNVNEDGPGVSSCATAVEVPDTRAKMPKQFEFDHVIHPATLDSIFQTVFTLGDEAMVPYHIDSIRVAACISNKAGTKLYGDTTAVREGPNDVSADVIMASEDSTLEPVVAVRGMKLKAVAATGLGSEGFVGNNRNLCSEIVWESDVAHDRKVTSLDGWLRRFAHKLPDASVLQLGDVMPDVSAAILAGLAGPGDTAQVARYTIRSVDDTCHTELRKIVPERHRALLSYENGPTGSDHGFNLAIVNSGDFPASRHGEVLRLLKADGFLLVLTPTSTGLASADVEQLRGRGLEEVDDGALKLPAQGLEAQYAQLFVKTVPHRIPPSGAGVSVDILVPVLDDQSLASSAVGAELVRRLSAAGMHPQLRDLAWLDAMNPDSSKSGLMTVSLLELDAPGSPHAHSTFDMDEAQYERIKKLIETADNLLWLTRGSQMSCPYPQNAVFQGWARTVRSEDSSKNIVTFDVHAADNVGAETAETITNIFLDTFFTPDLAVHETEYHMHQGKIYIPRLVPLKELNKVIENGTANALSFEKGALFDNKSHGPLRLAVGRNAERGALFFEEDPEASLPLRAFEVRIRVAKTHLTPVDLETAAGTNKERHVGVAVSGQVVEVGSSVVDPELRPGSKIHAVARGTVRTHVVVDSSLVVAAKPESEENEGLWNPAFLAAGPSDFLEIKNSGAFGKRLGGTKTVLVHAAASGYGQAVIHLLCADHARRLAEVKKHGGRVTKRPERIIAVVDNEEQREAVLRAGKMHRFTSGDLAGPEFVLFNDTDLVDRVMKITGGKGVSAVFDATVAGHPANVACVQEGGLVFRMASQNSKPAAQTNAAILKNVTYVHVDPFAGISGDLDEETEEETADYKAKLSAISLLTAKYADMQPPKACHTYPFSGIDLALKQMAKDSNLGHFLLEARDDDEVQIGFPSMRRSLKLDPEATYLVAGGLGGLGLEIADWLASRGAKHLALMSRSGFPAGFRNFEVPLDSSAASGTIKRLRNLENRGVHIYDVKADICKADSLHQGLSLLGGVMHAPKIKGAIHAAGVLRDGTYRNIDHEAWAAATRVKTVGSWNMHEALPQDLDFFVLLSSATGVIGNRGQANYVAGNTFQDALARYRRNTLGQPAVALDLGAILCRGMITREIMDLLRTSGFFGIRRQDFHIILERGIITSGDKDADARGESLPEQIVVGLGTGGLIRQNKVADPFWAEQPIYKLLNRVDLDVVAGGAARGGSDDQEGVSSDPILDTDLQPLLRSARSVEDVEAILLPAIVRAMVAIIPDLEADTITPDMTPTECRSDSLRGGAIDRWLRRATGISLGVGRVNSLALRLICEEVANRGKFGTEAATNGVNAA